jgi:osmotically-inducible protein OsmY
MAVGAAAGVGMAAVQDRTAGEVMDDGHVYRDIKARLMAAVAQGFRDTHVEVYNGNVLLSGAVPDEQHRQAALMIAHTYRTVHDVYDEMLVGQATTFGAAARDEFIITQIRTRLLASPRVRAVNINLEVFHGIVYLMGTARSDEELRTAAEIASTVGGVQRVVSFMTVRERPAPYYAQNTQQAPPSPEYITATPDSDAAAPSEASPGY